MDPSEIPKDIYNLLCNKVVPVSEDRVREIIFDVGEEVKAAMFEALGPEQERVGRLRLSGVGKSDRKIYKDYHGHDSEAIDGPTRIKFLYGHIIEALLLGLVELSGHTVTDKQKRCDVAGVKGHMDATIDGYVADVKSASSYGFKKFRDGTLPMDDPFGYVGQIKAYAHSQNNPNIGWLAMDKQNGTLAWLGYNLYNLPEHLETHMGYDIVHRVEEIKKLVSGPLPAQCYDTVPDGKSGNVRLASGCSYCAFKQGCFPGLRKFMYGQGPKYLVEVAKEPRVLEIPEGF